MNEIEKEPEIKIEIVESEDLCDYSSLMTENSLQIKGDENNSSDNETWNKPEIKIETVDCNYETEIKFEEADESFSSQPIEENFVKDIKPNDFEKSFNTCLTVQNEPQKTINENAYNVSKVCKDPESEIETVAANDCFYENQIKAEEDETFNTQTNDKDVVEDVKPKIDENTHNIPKTYDGQDSNVEIDTLGGWTFVSTIEIEHNLHLSLHKTNIDTKEIHSFVCDLCYDSFTSKRQIIHHIQTFHNTIHTPRSKVARNKLSVETNGEGMNFTKKINGCYIKGTDKLVQATMKKLHKVIDKTQLLECNVCQKTFTTKGQISRHLKKPHASALSRRQKPIVNIPENSTNRHTPNAYNHYKCDICSKTFRYTSQLVKHNRQHTGEKHYKCNVCEKTFTHISNLKRHGRVHTGAKPYKCNVCEKTFSHSCNLKDHKRLHSGERPYKCKVCEKTFTRSHVLKYHERVHSGDKPYKCNVCEKTFTGSLGLNRHKRMHTGEKHYKCNVCKKAFAQCSSLKNHERLHSGERPYKCNICKKTFTHSSTLKSHERLHSGENPYKCNVCEKTFPQSSNLKYHERLHSGEKPYKCNVCEKMFVHSSNLKYHERLHSGEKPYKCNVCEKMFAHSSNLKDHERLHSGEKPYKCNVCEKMFAQSSHLKNHERLHSGEKPYKCNVCEKMFVQSTQLKNHQRLHSGEY